jgi:hypothetical protein
MADNYQQVELYLKGLLPMLENVDPMYNLSNKEFDGFEDNEFNYGDSVSFSLTTRFQTVEGLDVTGVSSDIDQRKQTLTVNNATSGAFSIGAEDYWKYNAKDWLKKYGRAMVSEIGTKFGKKISNVAKDYTYRTYSDGVTNISSIKQINQIKTNLRNFGSAAGTIRMVLPDMIMPDIIDNNLAQFVLDRNERNANSWYLGRDMQAEYYTSNLLPTHNAGSSGEAGDILDITNIINTTGPANEIASQITVDNVSNDADSFKAGDIITLDPDSLYTPVTAGKGARFLTFIGHELSSQKVQVRVLADANAVTGTAVLQVFPRLVSDATDSTQNVNFDVSAVTSMQAKTLPSHVCGVAWTSSPIYCATPKLPTVLGFPSASEISPTGVGMRMTAGGDINTGTNKWVYNLPYGIVAVDEYMMRVAVPINQGQS